MKIQKWDEINGTGSSEDRMEAFLSSETDTYAILQLSYDQPEQTAFERFESLNGLARQGKQPNIDHYEVVYTAPLLPYKDLGTMLEQMYEKFNYGMIDGIINNGKADRIKDMEEKRPSVLEQLKAEPPEIDHPGKIRRPEERNIG